MRIALVSPLYETVPPPKYGGTERVIGALANDLVRRGHDVTLFAAGGSQTNAKLVPCSRRPLRTTMTRAELEFTAPHLHLKMLADVCARAGEFDIIHSHADIWTLPFVAASSTPIVVTMHGRLDLDNLRTILPLYPRTPLISISDSQREPLADLDVRWAATCYNGLDLWEYQHTPVGVKSDPYLAFVGRITPEKRPDWAIEVARRAGMRLKIAAKVDPLDQDYWTDEIEPLIAADPNVEFIGEIGEAEKPNFLSRAAGLVFPIDWPEPFGLVMIESMAAGTPVIALNNGSVPEVIEHGRSGFICETLDDMVHAARNLHQIDRTECIKASQRFSAAAMTDQYLATYRKVIAEFDRDRIRTKVKRPDIDLTAPLPHQLRSPASAGRKSISASVGRKSISARN